MTNHALAKEDMGTRLSNMFLFLEKMCMHVTSKEGNIEVKQINKKGGVLMDVKNSPEISQRPK